MEVIIDSRELAIKKEYSDENILYENLQVGDIQIIKKRHGENPLNVLVLERKTLSDLRSSLSDGRFSEQKSRINSTDFVNKGYIFEGILSKQDKKFQNIVRQIIIRIQFKDKMSIFLTGSTRDTISLIKEMVRKLEKDSKLYDNSFLKEQNYVETLHVCKKNNLTPQTCFIMQICQIPGISKKTAQSIASVYKNWTLLIEAIKDKKMFLDSLKNSKIGPKKYELLLNYII